MQDKVINFGSSASLFAANRQTSFGTIAPIDIISGPVDTKFYYWAGSIFPTSNPSITFGTIGRIRTGDQILKHDQWLVSSTGTESVVRVSDVNKENVVEPSHHFKNLPSSLSDKAPSWVKSSLSDKKD